MKQICVCAGVTEPIKMGVTSWNLPLPVKQLVCVQEESTPSVKGKRSAG